MIPLLSWYLFYYFCKIAPPRKNVATSSNAIELGSGEDNHQECEIVEILVHEAINPKLVRMTTCVFASQEYPYLRNSREGGMDSFPSLLRSLFHVLSLSSLTIFFQFVGSFSQNHSIRPSTTAAFLHHLLWNPLSTSTPLPPSGLHLE